MQQCSTYYMIDTEKVLIHFMHSFQLKNVELDFKILKCEMNLVPDFVFLLLFYPIKWHLS